MDLHMSAVSAISNAVFGEVCPSKPAFLWYQDIPWS